MMLLKDIAALSSRMAKPELGKHIQWKGKEGRRRS